MTNFWFLIFSLMLIIFIGSGLGIIMRSNISKKDQKRKSLIGVDFHNRNNFIKESKL